MGGSAIVRGLHFHYAVLQPMASFVFRGKNKRKQMGWVAVGPTLYVSLALLYFLSLVPFVPDSLLIHCSNL